MGKKRSHHVNIVKIKRHGTTYFRARLYLPFDSDLGMKPRPIDFIGKTEKEANEKRLAYKPEEAKLDKKTAFLDLIRDTHIPTVRQRIEADRISFGYGDYAISLLNRYLISPDKSTHPNLFRARIRRSKLGSLNPGMFKEYFIACVSDRLPAEATHRIKQQIVAALKHVREGLAFTIDALFDESELPTVVTNAGNRLIFDYEQIFQIITDSTKLIDDRALIGFLFMIQCRPSEMFALTWADVDLKKGYVKINKAMRRDKEKSRYKVTPGSKVRKKGKIAKDPGNREVVMPKLLCDLMTELKTWQQESGSNVNWPFLSVQGLQLTGDLFRAKWRGVKKRMGLPTEKGAPTFYTLKHAGNSFARSKGVSLEAQAAKMGQTSTRMAGIDYRSILTVEKLEQAAVFDQTPKAKTPNRASRVAASKGNNPGEQDRP
jgi:integrase